MGWVYNYSINNIGEKIMEEFIKNFENAIDGIEPHSLTSSTNFKKELPMWDSLSLLLIITMIDSNYNKVLSGNEIVQCETIADLYNLVTM